MSGLSGCKGVRLYIRVEGYGAWGHGRAEGLSKSRVAWGRGEGRGCIFQDSDSGV